MKKTKENQNQLQNSNPQPACNSNPAILTKFHAGYFRISLSLCSQSLLWKILTSPPASNSSYTHPILSDIARILPTSAFIFLWSLSLLSLLVFSLLFSIRCVFHFASIRAEFSHDVGVNYLFTPWISSLFLLQSSPLLRPNTSTYFILCWIFSIPILALDVKIYGQWFTKGKKPLAMAANPTSQISVLGNLAVARGAASMGFKEGAVCMFALGLAHYLVLFVTLYQRFLGSDSLPIMLRPVFCLFFAVPSMASIAWYSISSEFDICSKMLFFMSLFLFASLVSRPALFKRSMKRFTVAWWAYSFPLTILALAATRYAQEVKGGLANLMMLALSILSVIVTLALMALTAIKASNFLPREVHSVSFGLLPT